MNLNRFRQIVFVLILLPSVVLGQSFSNIAPEQGIVLVNPASDFGCGVSFVDFNRDGWDDITFGTKNSPIRFYQNNQGVFELIELEGIVLTNKEIKQITWVDYDNDGDYDFLVGLSNLASRLYVNQGDMTFVQANNQIVGLPTSTISNRNISWGDYDRDGDLDVYLSKNQATGTGNFIDDYPKMNHLLRNNNDGTFSDVTMEAGVSDSIGLTLGTVWWDYDLDGWPDLYVANDKWFDNALFHNNGDGTFTDIAEETGIGLIMDSMSASPADFDNDGDFDMYVTNTGLGAGGIGNVLFRNDNGIFTNAAPSAGLNLSTSTCWGALWFDYNNDTKIDLYVASNRTSPNYPGLNRLYRNNGNSTFSQANTATGLSYDETTAFTNALGDINNDGYPDFVSHTSHPYPAQISLNSGGTWHYIKFLLEGVISNRDGVGSLIECYTNGLKQIRYTTCGENYMSQNSYNHIIGIGDNEVVDSLVINWNSGHIDKYFDIAADQFLHLIEGASLSVNLNTSGNLVACLINEQLEVGEFESYAWSTGENTPSITATEPGVYFVTVTTEAGFQLVSDSLEVVFSPSPPIEFEVNHIACFGESIGSISISGVPENYVVIWEDSCNILTKSDLSAGIHALTVGDGLECMYEFNVEIIQPEPLSFEIESSPSCIDSNSGTITVSVLNDDTATILWDTEDHEFSLDSLATGFYYFDIHYLTSCIVSDSVEITAYPDLSISPLSISPLCFGDLNGSIIISELEVSNILQIEWFQVENSVAPEELGAGLYDYSMTDIHGCSYLGTVEIEEPDPLFIEAQYNMLYDGDPCAPSWYGNTTIAGGTAPYEIEWTFTDGNNESFTSLETEWECFDFGTVELLIHDANGCQHEESQELSLIIGLDEKLKSQFKIYPNPNSGTLNFNGEFSGVPYRIYNSLGQVLGAGLLENGQLLLNNFTQGIYLIETVQDYLSRYTFIIE